MSYKGLLGIILGIILGFSSCGDVNVPGVDLGHEVVVVETGILADISNMEDGQVMTYLEGKVIRYLGDIEGSYLMIFEEGRLTVAPEDGGLYSYEYYDDVEFDPYEMALYLHIYQEEELMYEEDNIFTMVDYMIKLDFNEQGFTCYYDYNGDDLVVSEWIIGEE